MHIHSLFTINSVFDRRIASFLSSSVKHLIGVQIFFGLPLGFSSKLIYNTIYFLYDSQKMIRFLATRN